MNKKNVSLGLVVLVVALVALGLNFYRIGQKNEVTNMTGQKQKMYSVIASAHQREADYKKDYASLPQPVKIIVLIAANKIPAAFLFIFITIASKIFMIYF